MLATYGQLVSSSLCHWRLYVVIECSELTMYMCTHSLLEPCCIRRLPVILDNKLGVIPSFLATMCAGR